MSSLCQYNRSGTTAPLKRERDAGVLSFDTHKPSGVERIKRKEETAPVLFFFASNLFSLFFWFLSGAFSPREKCKQKKPRSYIHKEVLFFLSFFFNLRIELCMGQRRKQKKKGGKKVGCLGPVSTVQLVPSKHQHLANRISLFCLSQFVVNTSRASVSLFLIFSKENCWPML